MKNTDADRLNINMGGAYNKTQNESRFDSERGCGGGEAGMGKDPRWMWRRSGDGGRIHDGCVGKRSGVGGRIHGGFGGKRSGDGEGSTVGVEEEERV